MITRRSIPTMLAGLAACVLAVTPSLAADKVKFGMLRVPQSLLVGIEKGYFKDEGIEVEPVFFRSGAELVPSLSTGQIDIAATAAGAALYNAMARGVNARLVADYWVPGPQQPGGDPNAIAVRKDLIDSGAVKSAKDLKGKTIAITARGQFTDMFVEMLLRSEGLTEKDVRIVTMSYPDMLAAFRGKAIDAAAAIDPGITIGEQQGFLVRFKKLSELLPGLNLGVVMFGDRLGKDNRDLGMRFMRAYAKSNSYVRKRLQEPGGRQEIAQVFQKYLPIKDPKMYEKIGLGLGDEDMSVNVDGKYGLKWQLQHYTERGLIRKQPDLEKGVDNSFAQAAAKALGSKKN
jgi:NitT/TauT family transport system substrate-binding protein